MSWNALTDRPSRCVCVFSGRTIAARVLLVGGLTACAVLPGPAGRARADVPLPNIPPGMFNITNYGAVGDGVATNTTAIQNAINAAGAAGGGTVVVPAGTFLSGPLTLKNNLNLWIDTNATLKMLPYGSYPGGTSPTDFISASKLHDIEISGTGTLEGQGAAWWAAYEADNSLVRPKAMFAPAGCTNILVQDITLQNPPNTHISFRASSGNACRNVTVRRITIHTPSDSPNTDGIDLNAANCLIQSNSISCGDDNIAVSSSSTGAAALLRDILIAHCAFGDGHGMSIGSYTQAGVSNMTVADCTFTKTTSGIRIKSARDRGGLLQRLTYANLTLVNVENPVFISAYYPDSTIPVDPSTNAAQPVTGTTPIYLDILISNVTITAASGRNAGRIYGLPEMTISNVVLAHVAITADKTFQAYHVQGIQFANPQITLPANLPTLTLYNTRLTLTNSAFSTNLVTFEIPTTNPASNVFALYNARVALNNTNVLGTVPNLALGGSILTVSNHLRLFGTTSLDFQLGTNATTLTAASNLVLAGTVNVHAGSGFTNTPYTAFTWGKGLTWATPVIGSVPEGYTCAFDTNTAGLVKLVVQLMPPVAPTNLTAAASNSVVRLAWSPSPGASGYKVKRSVVSGMTYSVIAVNVTNTEYPDAAVSSGTTYYYVVSAVNPGGESPDSSEASATPLPSIVPPYLAFQVGAPDQLLLAWPSDHIGWRLERQTNTPARLGTNWYTVPNSADTNQISISIDPACGSLFLRLVFP
jgi:polygalacturonase